MSAKGLIKRLLQTGSEPSHSFLHYFDPFVLGLYSTVTLPLRYNRAPTSGPIQNSMPRNIKIEIRLRSASKATRNDPRPTPPPEYYIRLVNEGLPDDTSDEMADSISDDVPFSSNSSKDDILGSPRTHNTHVTV